MHIGPEFGFRPPPFLCLQDSMRMSAADRAARRDRLRRFYAVHFHTKPYFEK